MPKEFTIELPERDRKRLIKHFERHLNHLDYELVMAKMDVEFYNDKYQPKHSLIYYQRALATVKKDIKMFEKLKNKLKNK